MRGSRTFRVFVSSTFSDLKAERNALQQRVFPRLRELCMQHGARFQAVDLRWGVSEEAALDQQTMNICLGEIDRCRQTTPRPNFIVLLGDRYGWQPLPPQIVDDEFAEICRRIRAEQQERLREWYVKNGNAVPPEFCLKPREGEHEDIGSWEAVERDLRSILLKAVEGMPLEVYDRMKYEASATEQEIAQGALRVADAPEHVFCFFRTVRDVPRDESAKEFVDLDASGNAVSEGGTRLVELKNRLRRLLPRNVHEYEARWTGSGVTTDHLDKLCEDVFRVLSRVIEEEIARLEEVDALEREVADHDTFGYERARFFTGRAGIVEAVGDYVGRPARRPLAIWGASGSGKSALMAKAVQQARADHPDAETVVRFIAATPGSSDIRSLLESLCRQISRRYGADESTVPAGYRELVEEFPKRLALATVRQPLVLFLDALDQLSDVEQGRSLVWLPPDLPEHVRLIVSTLPGECLWALESKLPATNVVELEPMPPAEGRELLGLWLEDAGRTLQDDQREEVLSKFERNGLPLYLKLAFEEARRWKSYTTDTVLSPDIPGVIRDLFVRLSSDANHGEMMVSHSLGYLASAKNGLSEDELLDVLAPPHDTDVLSDFRRRSPRSPDVEKLPVVLWSRLYFDLEPYLTERKADGASLMTFYHRQLGEVVAECYLAGDAKRERHRALAGYFGNQELETERGHKTIPNLRKLSELPYQETYGELWTELMQTLTGFDFALAKCGAGMIYELVGDYQTAVPALPEEEKVALELWETFFRERVHSIARGNDDWPSNRILLQLAMEHADDSPVTQAADLWLARGACNWTWLRRRTRPRKLPTQACLASVAVGDAIMDLAADSRGTEAVVVTGDYDAVHNRVSRYTLLHVDLQSLKVTRQQEITPPHPARPLREILPQPLSGMLTGSPAQMIRPTHQAPDRMQSLAILALKRVGFHNPELTRDWEPVALLEDGFRIVTGTHDGVVRIWDLNALEQALAGLQEDPEARNAIDVARRESEESGEQLRDRIGRIAALHSSLSVDYGLEFDLDDPVDDASLLAWQWMNRGLSNSAFRFGSSHHIELLEKASQRLIAAWFSDTPLTMPRFDNQVWTSSLEVRAIPLHGGVAVETADEIALLLELREGEKVVSLESIDASLPPSPGTRLDL